ncbi:Calcium-dependent protease precursor [Pseudooceanicola marinus]|uniref:Calcium-dependent protease n=1 Tax=Pseudooceanicola marinus TaxID=396013 RepID=A0A1X6ZLP8_9RHOB|nr:S8 family serine peptidase [Pseudooceanicola marinus]SLN55212.1 Calcium-dependent protease precursor [Pseudooceanicola marinus]
MPLTAPSIQPQPAPPLAPKDTGPDHIGLEGSSPAAPGAPLVPPQPMPDGANPLYGAQWHFRLIGDIEEVWDDYTGVGVTVAIYDDGVEAGHPDLAANYDDGAELNLVDASPNSSSDGHGTAVAGLIGAADNAVGGVGVAHGATLVGVDYLNDAFQLGYTDYLAVLEQAARYDVINNSWGSMPAFREYTDIGEPTQQAGRERDAIETAVVEGRGGLGTIFLKAAGNYAHDSGSEAAGVYGNAHGDGLNNLHEIITVGATSSSGFVASYSNWGHSLLISAPAAAVTTDRSGGAGYSGTEYTSGFGGTSAATPVTAGVTALMLEANPELHWRDVQSILAASAAQTGSTYGSGASGYERDAWGANGATTWNGGGMSYASSYGYGMVDAHAAVRMAEVWSRMQPDTAATLTARTLQSSGTAAIRDHATSTIRLDAGADTMRIDHVYVTIDYEHSWESDLTFSLVSASGYVVPLKQLEGGSSYDGDWTFGVASLRGMTDGGSWSLRVTDTATGDEGRVNSVRLEFEGQTLDADDIYTFTDDFRALRDEEAGRAQVVESNGGTDWINAAALTGHAQISLQNSSATLRVNGAPWTEFDGRIEHMAAGDGHDTLAGNDADNQILAGRGNDILQGGSGDDTLEGGAGEDSLSGSYGDDVAHGDGGDDLITADAGFDTIYGGTGADLLNGGSNADELHGDSGDDRLIGELGLDHLYGGAGNDLLYANAENDLLYGGAGADTLNGGTQEDRLYGGIDNDRLHGEGGFDRLEGQSGDDWLDGGRQADNLFGGTGVDTLYGAQGLDRLFGGEDRDRLYGGSGDDGLFGGDGDDIMGGQDGDDRLFGGRGKDLLSGGAGNDTLYGNADFDTLLDSSGDDVYYGGFNADTFYFTSFAGQDTIADFDALNDLEEIVFQPGTSPITDYDDLRANHMEDLGGSVRIHNGGGNTILLAGVNFADLDEADFAFY